MSRLAYFDVVGGAAGDMLLAALLDAGAPEEAVGAAVEAVLPGRFVIGLQEVERAGTRARHLRVRATGGREPALVPRPFGELMATLDAAPVARGVKTRAGAVLDHLAGAEARVHGIGVDRLVLHELGDDDTLLDVVGVAAALEALEIGEVFVSSIPLAPGITTGSHGPMPLPSPAVLELLRGFEVRGGGAGETVTPTAAAIFAALGTSSPLMPPMTLERTGVGAGSRDVAGHPNVVRALVGMAASPEAVEGLRHRDLVLLEANLDDLTPELVADAAQGLLAAGALDVWTTLALMKKGRPGVVLSALCEPSRATALRTLFFESTSTFGVRSAAVRRDELDRRVDSLEVAGGSVRVKLGLLGGRVVSATPEHDDVADLAQRVGRPVRDVYAEAVAAALRLRSEASGPPTGASTEGART